MNFTSGQKGKLNELGVSDQFSAVLNVAAKDMNIDISCFGLDSEGKLSDDRFMIFFNQAESPGKAITLEATLGKSIFRVNLLAIPSFISKLVFTATIDGTGTMSDVGGCSFEIANCIHFPFSGSNFHQEKAVIIAEIYRKDGQWRFGAVGQGFNGGISALLAHFGGTEAPRSAINNDSKTPAAESLPASPKVSLSKIKLEKRGDKVSLDKKAGQGFGRIRVNLNWNQTPTSNSAEKKSGFFDKLLGRSDNIDLDLACLFEMKDGSKGIVQALGNSWGNFKASPYIHLEGDDRSGASANGENIFINGDFFNEIKRALIFTFIYSGVPNWAATDGLVTIDVPNQSQIEVRLDGGGNQMMCAIAMIENKVGDLQVTKLMEYFTGNARTTAHEIMDRHYGFGLAWRAATKD